MRNILYLLAGTLCGSPCFPTSDPQNNWTVLKTTKLVWIVWGMKRTHVLSWIILIALFTFVLSPSKIAKQEALLVLRSML